MLQISTEHTCYHCKENFLWRIFHKEAVAPYTEGSGLVKVHHSGQPEINRLDNVNSYAFIDTNMVVVDVKCLYCGIINRINYQIDKS